MERARRWEANNESGEGSAEKILEGGLMPLCLTLLPIEWTQEAGRRKAIAHSVEDLPAKARVVVSSLPGGWRVVRNTLTEFDQEKRCPTAGQAAEALRTWIEGDGSKAAE